MPGSTNQCAISCKGLLVITDFNILNSHTYMTWTAYLSMTESTLQLVLTIAMNSQNRIINNHSC